MAKRRSRPSLSNIKLPSIESYLNPVSNPKASLPKGPSIVNLDAEYLDSYSMTGTQSSSSKSRTMWMLDSSNHTEGGDLPGVGGSSVPFNAIKVVSKEAFWKRVQQGKERADALVREVLAQALLSQGGIQVSFHSYQQSLSSLRINIANEDLFETGSYFPIVKIFGVLETLDDFSLELELMRGQDLFDQLSLDGVFPEQKAKQVVCYLTCHSNTFLGLHLCVLMI
jgi:hypothetical protein